MTRTRALPLVLLGIVGLAIGFLGEQAIAGSGRPIIVPPVTLALVLVAIAVALLAAAWPVRQAVRSDDKARRVDYRHATNVLLLAKASSTGGSLIAGVVGGIVAFQVTRPVVLPEPAIVAAASLVAAIALLVAGILAESWCVLPPDDESGTGPTPEQQPA